MTELDRALACAQLAYPVGQRELMLRGDVATSFAALLRTYRTAAGLSQRELARHAGLSPRGIADLERGERRLPRRETVRRLATALGLNTTRPIVGP